MPSLARRDWRNLKGSRAPDFLHHTLLCPRVATFEAAGASRRCPNRKRRIQRSYSKTGPTSPARFICPTSHDGPPSMMSPMPSVAMPLRPRAKRHPSRETRPAKTPNLLKNCNTETAKQLRCPPAPPNHSQRAPRRHSKALHEVNCTAATGQVGNSPNRSVPA